MEGGLEVRMIGDVCISQWLRTDFFVLSWLTDVYSIRLDLFAGAESQANG